MKSNLSAVVVDCKPSVKCSDCGGLVGSVAGGVVSGGRAALLTWSDGTRLRLCLACLARLCREAGSALVELRPRP